MFIMNALSAYAPCGLSYAVDREQDVAFNCCFALCWDAKHTMRRAVDVL